jgi:hypothetical protein
VYKRQNIYSFKLGPNWLGGNGCLKAINAMIIGAAYYHG